MSSFSSSLPPSSVPSSSAYAQERLFLLQKVASLLTVVNTRFQSLTTSLDRMAQRSEAVQDVKDVWREALVSTTTAATEGGGEGRGGKDDSFVEGKEDD